MGRFFSQAALPSIAGGADNNNVSGDNIGGNVGSSGIINARDIKVYKNTLESTDLDKSIISVLLNAREKAETMGLSHADKSDVADDLGTLTTELTNSEKDVGRIKSLLKRIGVIAPPVLAILQSAKLISEFITLSSTP